MPLLPIRLPMPLPVSMPFLDVGAAKPRVRLSLAPATTAHDAELSTPKTSSSASASASVCACTCASSLAVEVRLELSAEWSALRSEPERSLLCKYATPTADSALHAEADDVRAESGIGGSMLAVCSDARGAYRACDRRMPTKLTLDATLDEETRERSLALPGDSGSADGSSACASLRTGGGCGMPPAMRMTVSISGVAESACSAAAACARNDGRPSCARVSSVDTPPSERTVSRTAASRESG
mmetsp:Transcript_41096/g.86036  ORF Transcript_41096/g.86036 Transcript_41096/m.86036 type:complete len:242 (+) Transcript_41096:849-1574(+)